METEDLFDFETLSYSKNINLSSFSMLSVIGKGSYAKVVLVKKLDNGKLYALKILKKKQILKRKQTAHTQIERSILAEVNHPFIVNMDYAFQNERKLFFAIEYCPGGELFNLLQKMQKFNETQIMFYTVQIIMAFQYLHSKNIIYRDYLGSLIYEMFTGLPPFYDENRNELFEKIKYSSFPVSKKMSPNFIDFIKKLMVKDPKKRLGVNGAEEIKNHEWLKGVIWDQVYEKQIIPPYYPNIKNEKDVSNFDCEFTECQIYSPENSSIGSGNMNFENFSYYKQSFKSSSSNNKQLFGSLNEYDEFEDDMNDFEFITNSNKGFSWETDKIANSNYDNDFKTNFETQIDNNFIMNFNGNNDKNFENNFSNYLNEKMDLIIDV